VLVSSPQTVLEKRSYMHERLGFGSLLLEGQAGAVPHAATMGSLELLGREVLPHLQQR
jgi:hypothetical protein